jgi:hypothetical protein
MMIRQPRRCMAVTEDQHFRKASRRHIAPPAGAVAEDA